MTDGGEEKGILSGAEIEALLDEKTTDEPSEQAAPVLLLSRRRVDEELLRGQITQLGGRVTTVRDPFTALDHIRWQKYRLIVSDFSLWADDGRLLFERLETTGEVVPVVFIEERNSGSEARALRAGAAALLTRPLRAGEVDTVVRTLLLRGDDDVASPPAVDRPLPVAGEIADRGPAATPGELAWLRFLFEARRRLRRVPAGEDRILAVVDAAREFLAPRTSMVIERSAEGLRAVVQASPHDGSYRHLIAAFESVVAGSEEGAVRRATDGGGTICLRCSPHGSSHLVLTFAEPVRDVDRPFVDELAILLRDL